MSDNFFHKPTELNSNENNKSKDTSSSLHINMPQDSLRKNVTESAPQNPQILNPNTTNYSGAAQGNIQQGYSPNVPSPNSVSGSNKGLGIIIGLILLSVIIIVFIVVQNNKTRDEIDDTQIVYNSDSNDYSGGSSDDSDHVYYSDSSNNPTSIITDPGDYEMSSSKGEPHFTSAKLCDIVYNGLGNKFNDIMSYSGQTNTPGTVGFGDHGLEDNYYTYFGNRDQNCHLIFNVTGQTYFEDSDLCYGAKGWLSRVFDYEKTQGPCNARAFADVLNAKNTYVLNDTSSALYVPSNLDTGCLYVIEADIETAQGKKSCTIYLDANGDSYDISSDTWVEVILNN